MESMALILILALALWAVRWVKNADQPQRVGRRIAVDPTTGRAGVSGEHRHWLGALLAAAIGYGIARWRNGRELTARADSFPVVRRSRCGWSLTADPIAGRIAEDLGGDVPPGATAPFEQRRPTRSDEARIDMPQEADQ